MHTTHSTFSLAGHTLHRITFDPATFTDADLLWLPHHAQLADAGRKRKADHLAGRIAAAHALPDHTMPAIGPSALAARYFRQHHPQRHAGDSRRHAIPGAYRHRL